MRKLGKSVSKLVNDWRDDLYNKDASWRKVLDRNVFLKFIYDSAIINGLQHTRIYWFSILDAWNFVRVEIESLWKKEWEQSYMSYTEAQDFLSLSNDVIETYYNSGLLNVVMDKFSALLYFSIESVLELAAAES